MKERKFYNVIQKNGNECTILLYGYIGQWDDVKAQDVTTAIMEAAAACQNITVRINSMGGEVYEGIAIFNILRLCTADVKIYVDGIAASAASFIATCGKPVYMGKYSELMLHEASGGCFGNKHDLAKCITELTNMDDTLCQIYADKSGKSKDEIKAAYFDGQDHWLTAQQALDLGLIDGIYDMDEADGTPQQKYTTIYNRLNHNQPQKKDKNMFYTELAQRDARFKDCKSDEDVLQIINSLGTSAQELAEKNKLIDKLKKDNEDMKAEEQAKQDEEKKQLLDDAEKDGRITPETRKCYETAMDADFENGKKLLESLQPSKKVKDLLEQHKGDQGGSKGTFAERKKEISDRFYNNNRY